MQVPFSWSSLSPWSLPSPNSAPISTRLLSRLPWGGMMPSFHSKKQNPESQNILSPLGCSQQAEDHISQARARTPRPSSMPLEASHSLEALRGFAPPRGTKTQHGTGSGSPMGVESRAMGASSQMNSPDPQATMQQEGPMRAPEPAGLSHGTLTALQPLGEQLTPNGAKQHPTEPRGQHNLRLSWAASQGHRQEWPQSPLHPGKRPPSVDHGTPGVAPGMGTTLPTPLGPRPSPTSTAPSSFSPSTRSPQKGSRASSLEGSYSQAPQAGHEDAEAFRSAGAGQQDLAGDETGGQYNGLFVLPAPLHPAPCHSKAGIQELIDVIKVWHDFATASEGSGGGPGSAGGGGAPRVLFSL